MLIIISPAKTLDFETPSPYNIYTIPDHLEKSQILIDELIKKTPDQLSGLMHVSSKLAMLNYQRYREWHLPFSHQNSKQAIFAFRGEVYTGLDIHRFSENALKYTQEHLRILSGLHGSLRPLDLIQPYRLEMGTKMKAGSNKNLYEFWGDEITKSLQSTLDKQNDNILINLASDEYFRSINLKLLKARIITPVFKEYKNGSYKFLSVYGKRARGMMARFIIQNRLKSVNELKHFDEDGYYYNENLSSENKILFTRNG